MALRGLRFFIASTSTASGQATAPTEVQRGRVGGACTGVPRLLGVFSLTGVEAEARRAEGDALSSLKAAEK